MTEPTPETLWRDLLEKDDRTSPEEYPDMALITFDEFCYCIDALTEQRVAAAVERCAVTARGGDHTECEHGEGYIDGRLDAEASIRAVADRPAPEGAAPDLARHRCSTPSQEDTGSVSGDREPGWYWVRMIPSGPWRPYEWYYSRDGEEMWVSAKLDHDPVVVGPRIVPPTDAGGPGSALNTPSQEDAGSVSGERWPDPTPEMLTTREFEAVWGAIKTWDIGVPGVYGGYCGATGNHVRAILDALAPPNAAGGPGSASNTESSTTQDRKEVVPHSEPAVPKQQAYNAKAPVAPPGPTAGDVKRARSIIDDAANIVGGPGAGMLCKDIADALATERASASAELLAQIRDDFRNLSIAVDGFAEVAGCGEERAIIGGKELEVRRYMRALADKLTEAK